jgi:hypothetical protein
MQRRSARWGARDDSDHAAGVGRGLKGGVSDHAVRPSERRGRTDSRDAAEGRTMQWGSDTGRKKGLGPCSGPTSGWDWRHSINAVGI